MPILVEVTQNPLSDQQLHEIANTYQNNPYCRTGEDAAKQLQHATEQGHSVYLGIFNSKIVAAVSVSGDFPARSMHYLQVHPATRGRGVAERLIAEVRRYETERGSQWLSMEWHDPEHDMSTFFLSLGFIPNGESRYRCALV